MPGPERTTYARMQRDAASGHAEAAARQADALERIASYMERIIAHLERPLAMPDPAQPEGEHHGEGA